MSEIGDGGSRETPAREGTGYVRVPLPVAALIAAAVLGVLLAIGLYANANLRSPGVVLPTPATAVAAATLPPATLAPTTLPVGATATPAPAAVTATSPPTAEVVATRSATAGSTPQVGATGESAMPTPVAVAGSQSPTALPTVEPTLAADVGQAYENFWRVRSKALLELDPTHLPEVMDGDYLEGTVRRIEELRTENQAIKTQVSLSYSVIQASSEVANVVDDIVDDSVYVKIGTDDAISEPTSDQLRILYELRNLGGIWKVVDSVRSE